MRILQVNSAKTFGGGERHFVDLCQGLVEKGHEVFALINPQSNWGDRLHFLNDRIFKISIKNSLDFPASLKIASLCKAEKIEIIHAHIAKDFFPVSLACRMLQDTKFFLTRHVLFPMRSIYRVALSNLTKAIAVSEAVAMELSSTLPQEKIVIVPNGIRVENWLGLSRYSREDFLKLHGISREAQIISTLGELKELKGQREFVLAAQIVLNELPRAFFIVVGQDNTPTKSFRRELKRLVNILGIEKNFLFLDWVEDTAELFACTDVFVSPSRSESFGLAILEAMASGVAIVATRTHGAMSLLEDGVSGKLVPIREALELASAIKSLLADEELRKTLGKNAQEKAKQFSIDRMIDQIEELYRSSIA